jgi:putative transposase
MLYNRTYIPIREEVKHVKLVLKFYPDLNDSQMSIIEELSFHTTKLYNIANYECKEKGYKNYYILEKELKSNWHKAFLHSHTYQHCLKMLEQDWKSYFACIKDYKKNPQKYKGVPQPPKYKHVEKRKNEIIFTNLAIRRKGTTLLLSLSKHMQKRFEVDSLKVKMPRSFPLPTNARMQQIRIQFDRQRKQWVFLIIYQVEEREIVTNTNIMSIDLGLDNLATITFSHHIDSYIICGRPMKSLNGYINKRMATLQGIRMQQVGSENFKNTKQINDLRNYRHHYMMNYLHKASRTIIQLAQKYDVSTIVVGDIKGIKQENQAKTFVQVPIQKLPTLIDYKAKLDGRSLVYQEESYTSGVSAIDLEPITKKSYNKNRRFKRGLFRSNTGLVIHADVNGSLNIMRKYLKERCTPKLIELVRDNGCVNHPQRIRVA